MTDNTKVLTQHERANRAEARLSAILTALESLNIVDNVLAEITEKKFVTVLQIKDWFERYTQSIKFRSEKLAYEDEIIAQATEILNNRKK